MKTLYSQSNNNNNNAGNSCSPTTDHILVTDPQSGEVICSNCGQVLTEKALENRAEWCSFNSVEESTKSRIGAPTSLARHDMGLATVIGRTNKDASGNTIDAAMRSTMDRLRIWDYRTQITSSTDRNLRSAFGQLDKLKDKLGLSDAAIEKTAYIYRKAQDKGLVRGRTITSVLAAAAYIVAREIGISKTLHDISISANIGEKELSRSYRLLITELDLKVPLIDPVKCIAKIANSLDLKEMTKRRAISIMHEVIKSGISAGKNPMGLAAVVLYFASLSTGNEHITQMDIADASGVTEVTIRNRLKDLRNKLELLN
jgi:transcription initiation factor TFIIB